MRPALPIRSGLIPSELDDTHIALVTGGLALALVLGALIFEYGFGFSPCELCMAQRYMHYSALALGLVGGGALWRGILSKDYAPPLALVALLFVAASGLIGVYHAGVEWHFWAGPAACTGDAYRFHGGVLNLNADGPRCDIAAWRLFGISMAGYNAVISLAIAMAGGILWRRNRQAPMEQPA